MIHEEKQGNNKTKLLHVHLSEDEYSKIHKQYKNNTCLKVSEYTRKKLLDEYPTTYYLNQSPDDFMTELMPMRKSLYVVNNSFNQAVQKLNSMRQITDDNAWLRAWELDEKMLVKQVEKK